MITEIMHLDNGYDDLSASDRKKQRQLHLKQKVDDYFAWVKLKYEQVTKNSTIGKALAYSINQEQYLRKFLNDGNIPMDNNYAVQAIRPFTIGRKNFYRGLTRFKKSVPVNTKNHNFLLYYNSNSFFLIPAEMPGFFICWYS